MSPHLFQASDLTLFVYSIVSILLFASFDIEFPEEIDDEYWPIQSLPESANGSVPGSSPNSQNALPAPKQPDGVPSKISHFVAYLKLGQILAFALRTIYTINKSKVLLGFVGEEWEHHIVAELGEL